MLVSIAGVPNPVPRETNAYLAISPEQAAIRVHLLEASANRVTTYKSTLYKVTIKDKKVTIKEAKIPKVKFLMEPKKKGKRTKAKEKKK
jgi:soluble P-type ATPase